jgi:hypothetical protein
MTAYVPVPLQPTPRVALHPGQVWRCPRGHRLCGGGIGSQPFAKWGVMSDYKEVPVLIAKEIADIYSKNQVVILCWDQEHELTHTTTYGKTAFDKENAAAIGRKLSEAIGCDMGKRQDFEDFHQDYSPALYKEALEILKVIARRQGCTSPQFRKIERLLKAAGHVVRRA